MKADGTFDPLDELTIVHEVKPALRIQEWNYLTGGGEVVHGGPQQPENYSY